MKKTKANKNFYFLNLKIKKIKKEVIHPQVPLRIPCDDLTLLTELRFELAKKLTLT